MTRVRSVAALLAAALTVPTLLAGCSAGSAGPAPAAAATGAADTAHGDAVVRVGLIEWTIEVSRHRVSPGRVVLRVLNAGATEHNLVVRGRAGRWQTADLRPGERARLAVRAMPGEQLTLSSHEPGQLAGMHTRLRVPGPD